MQSVRDAISGRERAQSNVRAQARARKQIEDGRVRAAMRQPKPALGVDSALARRTPKVDSEIRGQAARETQQMVGEAQEDRWGKVFAAPPTEYQTQFSMPGLNTRPGAGGMSVNTGGARALDTPFQWDMGTGGSGRHELSPTREAMRAKTATEATRATYGESPGRGRVALLNARAVNQAGFDAAPFLAKQEAREQQMSAREELRQQRGIQRGDTMQQAQVGAMQQGAMLPAHLRQQQSVNPMLAMMQRRPELAIQMMRLQQQGMLGQQQLGLRGMELGQERALAQQEIGMRGQELGVQRDELASRQGIESMRVNADREATEQRARDAMRLRELEAQHRAATNDLERQRIANEAREIDARLKQDEADRDSTAMAGTNKGRNQQSIRENLVKLAMEDQRFRDLVYQQAQEMFGDLPPIPSRDAVRPDRSGTVIVEDPAFGR